MIKANELRIGNYIICDSNSEEYKYTEIYKIDNESDSLVLNDLVVNEFSPIPLTPEILEACGFKKIPDAWVAPSDAFILDSENVPISFDDWGTIGIKQESLHQLQNLYFALTGTELEVSINSHSEK